MSQYTVRNLILAVLAAAPVLCQSGIPPITPTFPTMPTIPPPVIQFNNPLVIASIGDSNASGEGAPNAAGSSPSIWSLAQCHRSENSGRTLAANALSSLVNLEYSNFACSGASINVGLLGPYVGMPVNLAVLPALHSQVQQVRDWMNASSRRQNLDVLIISIGINDAGFGKVVGSCLNPFVGFPSWNTGDCAQDSDLIHLIANGDPDNETGGGGLNHLAAALDELASTIKQQLNPRYVLITEYPNPLHDEQGRFCNGYDEKFSVIQQNLTSGAYEPETGIAKWLEAGGAMKYVLQNEAQFMENSLINPLNLQLSKAAQRHAADGWIYVGGMVEMTLPHGYCAKEPWDNTLKLSFQTQGDVDGTAHLNKSGQKAYQWLLQKKIVELFDIASAPPVEPFENQVTHENIGDQKRIVIEVSPTADYVEGDIEYRLLATTNTVLINPLSVPLKRDTSYTTRQVYYADLPGTENLTYGQWFDYIPVIRYGKTQSTINGFIAGAAKEYTVYRYQEISGN